MPRNYTDQSKIDVDLGWLDVVIKNKEIYLDLTSKVLADVSSQSKVTLAPGYRLVRSDVSETKFIVALLCDTTKEIVYYIHCIVWEEITLDKKPVTQTVLWRTSNIIHKKMTSGITEDVFLNYLLEVYNIIASDNAQTREGRDFWVRQLGLALHFGDHVYRYDLINSILEEITDHEVIRDNSCDLWGDDEKYTSILALISKEKLKIN